MTLRIQPLFGDVFSIPFDPPKGSWKEIYKYLYHNYYSDKRIHQLRLFHGESTDLSHVQEGDILRLLVTDLMAERWVSEYNVVTPDNITFSHGTLTWLDKEWGNPYENLSIQYRTPLTLHITMRESEGRCMFSTNTWYTHERGGRGKEYVGDDWFPTLREACEAFRVNMNSTASTVENIIHLWDLYHDVNQQGIYYDN